MTVEVKEKRNIFSSIKPFYKRIVFSLLEGASFSQARLLPQRFQSAFLIAFVCATITLFIFMDVCFNKYTKSSRHDAQQSELTSKSDGAFLTACQTEKVKTETLNFLTVNFF